MTHGIASLSVISVRVEPSHKSEMVTQLLFGETLEILESQNEWIRIRCSYDGYEGWILQDQQLNLSLAEYQELNRIKSHLCFDLVQIMVNQSSIYSIVLGSNLPWFWGNTCRIGANNYVFDGNARLPERFSASNGIIENAFMYLNTPYLWGGRSPFGIDCSGFTQMVFKLSGFKLKRDAWMQAEQGDLIHLLDESRPGDLVFFDNEDQRIIHVGILTAKNKVIHASGKVRVDNIDHQGIYNNDTRKYTHSLRLIRRLF
jgi:gamma-D-glutamyl-L-lysine dipeptidyl-peptidase